MSERQNVQTVTKWVGEETDARLASTWYRSPRGNACSLKLAETYDSPTDVPDDCTPVRVRVETWEEEGEPKRMTEWASLHDVDAWEIVGMGSGNDVWKTLRGDMSEVAQVLTDNFRAGLCLTAIPKTIPTETKRTVTLDPEPTETGCRFPELADAVRERIIQVIQDVIRTGHKSKDGSKARVRFARLSRSLGILLADLDVMLLETKIEADDE